MIQYIISLLLLNSMTNILEDIKQAEHNCKAHGVRLTSKRKQVLSGLLKADKALSAYELVDQCKDESGKTMPAMSVYRILDFLAEEHLVHKLDLNNKYVACSHITCSPEHDATQFLICEKCQRVDEIDIDPSMIEQLQSNMENAGFQVTSPQLEIKGICDDCITPDARDD